jgi:hypothetical protein
MPEAILPLQLLGGNTAAWRTARTENGRAGIRFDLCSKRLELIAIRDGVSTGKQIRK